MLISHHRFYYCCLRSLLYYIVFVAVLPSTTRCFTLEGSTASFVTFPKWYHAFENTLSFEFRTRKENGLLLYTDDGGNSNFYELSLVGGQLRLRFKIGRRQNARQTHPQILELSLPKNQNAADGAWHKVELYQFWERVKLTLDGSHEYLALEQQDFVFGNYETNSHVYIGGLPKNTPISQLSSPTVTTTERFSGSIRNLVYRTLPYGVTAPHIVDKAGLRDSDDDFCLKYACSNNGVCYSTDDGARCECPPDFEGKNCEFERASHEATFVGSEFLSYDFTSNRNGLLSREEQLSLSFKTRRPSGMLFYSGDNQDYLHLAIKDGAVVATSNLGGGSKEVRVVPYATVEGGGSESLRFNDNRWHRVVLHRKLTTHVKGSSYLHLSVNVDGVFSDAKQTVGEYELLSSTVAYVGGKPKNKFVAQVLEDSSFVGCLTKIRFRADNERIDFLELAKRNDDIVRVYGNLTFVCREPTAPEPVTFKGSENSYLVLPGWLAAKSGSLSFKFKTNEPDGVILYNNGGVGSNDTDFVAIELAGARLYLILNLGTGALRLQAGAVPLNDKRWHTVLVVRDGRNGRITVDDSTTEFSTPGSAARLDLGGSLYLGGWPPGANLTPSVWTKSLNKRFVGCLRDFGLNGIALNLADFSSDKSGASLELGCAEMLPRCQSRPCRNGGHCVEGWNRYWCDCSTTRYAGTYCDRDPVTVSFADGRFVHLYVGRRFSEVEDIDLKFRTSQPVGALISASSTSAPDRIDVLLTDGQLEYRINFGQTLHTYFWGAGLADDRWHALKIRRRALKLEFSVDNEQTIIKELPSSNRIILEHDILRAGGSDTNSLADNANSLYSSFSTGFRGQMADFVFNGMNVFAEAADKSATDWLPSNPKYNNGSVNGADASPDFSVGGSKDNTVTFASRRAFVLLRENLSPMAFRIAFHFRTLEANGLILYGAGRSKDFLAVELYNGKLRYRFNAGDMPRFLSSESTLNDFEWHSMSISKVGSDYALDVDRRVIRLESTGSNRELNLEGFLYVGGVEKANYSSMPGSVTSKFGFRGCLASLSINGISRDPLSEAVLKEGVKSGCEGPTAKCQPDSCANGGVCLQQWQNYNCDCLMTTFGGPRCADESISYVFGPSPGIIVYSFRDNERPSLTDDLLALGVITNQSKAAIMRVDSITSSDYLFVYTEDGYVYIDYDVGSGVKNLKDLIHRVNDGKYHIVRFVRSGANSTLQIDGNEIVSRTPARKGELGVFNNQDKIRLGGRVNPTLTEKTRRSLRNRVADPFVGVLSGVFYNGIRILDKLAEKDSRVAAEGDVLYYRMQKPAESRASPSATTREWSISDDFPPLDGVGVSSLEPTDNADDFISSGGEEDMESSGCSSKSADEEECNVDMVYDDTTLITPYLEQYPSTTAGTSTATLTTRTTLTSTASAVAGPPTIVAPTLPSEDSSLSTTTETSDSVTDDILPEISEPDSSTSSSTVTCGDSCSDNGKDEVATAVGKPPSQPSNEAGTTIPLARPPASGSGGTANTGGGLKSAEEGSRAFPRTSVIAGVAVALIVVLIVVVFIVFKCRNKNNDSYSVDEGKAYTALYNGPPENNATGKLLVAAKTARVNGTASRTGKSKKDVKEWYV